MIPSTDALRRHWMRTCWVVSAWSQAIENNITNPSLEGKQPDSNTLIINWDDNENIANIR
jgi:hypothetical protein